MFKKYYLISLSPFIYYVIMYTAWMAVWIWIPAEELVWGPIKWIIIVLFAPIGIILIGALTGYRVEFNQQKLKVGFFPFIRNIPVSKLKGIRKGAIYPMSLWQTSAFVTLVLKKGKPFSFPCNDAENIIKTVKPFIEKNL